jgi:hypothetical protein
MTTEKYKIASSAAGGCVYFKQTYTFQPIPEIRLVSSSSKDKCYAFKSNDKKQTGQKYKNVTGHLTPDLTLEKKRKSEATFFMC